MAYVVKITPNAEHDLAQLYDQINARYSDAALQWYRGIKEAILSLEDPAESLSRNALERQVEKVALQS